MNTLLELPQVEPEATERADAARNRERILCAAARLFSERGAGCVSMEGMSVRRRSKAFSNGVWSVDIDPTPDNSGLH